MFCIKCGKEFDEVSKVCPHCGTQQTSSKKNVSIVIKVVPIIIIIAIILLIINSATSYKSIEKNFYTAYSSGNAKKIVSMLPNDYIEYVYDTYDIEKDDIVSYVEKYFDDFEYETYKKITIDKTKNTNSKDILSDYYLSDTDLEIDKAIKITLMLDDEKSTDYAIKISGTWYSMNQISFVDNVLCYYILDDIFDYWDF